MENKIEKLGRYEKKEILELLKRALKNVSADYVLLGHPSELDIFVERVFAYELYHQMRLLFRDKHGVVNGEYRKYLKLIPDIDNNKTYIPDLVVHQPSTLDRNFLAIEIKTSPSLNRNDLKRDLGKLEFYTRPPKLEGLGFQLGVMLIVNYDIEKEITCDKSLKDELRSFLEKYPRNSIWTLSFEKEKDGIFVPIVKTFMSDSPILCN
ncbi:hypothetical protein HW511_13775 [Asaia siamensis]|nr:hypothetical protein [Asaia siamensis]GBR06880.1 hypothetical protein AA0323_1574 [Asaia siamensis NRIC 0323]